jgi:hypothetical protein
MRDNDRRKGMADEVRHAVIETNPDALGIAERADRARAGGGPTGPLAGIPILLKDNIATHDRTTTTAGSLALEGSIPSADSFVAARLRDAGAVLLGKANLSEWANFRSTRSSSGWSSQGGQTRNPYALDRNPCGSSSGSGVADPAAGAIQVSGTTDLAEETKMVWSQLVIGTDSWARIKVSAPEPMPGFTDLPDKWLHIDKTKIGNGWAPDPSDPAGVSAVLNLLTDVTESSPGKFTGTVDLSGAKDLYLVNEIEISLAGEHAKALPFEAEVDAKGRLASFTVKLPATGGDETDELKVTFSDFGSAPAITAPAASETQEAPESTYPLFS